MVRFIALTLYSKSTRQKSGFIPNLPRTPNLLTADCLNVGTKLSEAPSTLSLSISSAIYLVVLQLQLIAIAMELEGKVMS